MTEVRVFFCEELPRLRRSLRRYRSSEQKCPGPKGGMGYCNAAVAIDEVDDADDITSGDLWPHDDPRWPQFCEGCALPFGDDEPWQLFHDRLYRRLDTGAVTTWREAPIGAVRNCTWLADRVGYRGPDGRCLEVKLPGGHSWIIDSRAKNCTLPNDLEHKCWVRHGRPEDGSLHVDKNGRTCSAGAGSIVSPNWHGFLHHGVLSEQG